MMTFFLINKRSLIIIADFALLLLGYLRLLQCTDIVKSPYPREGHGVNSSSNKSPLLPGRGVVGQHIDRCIRQYTGSKNDAPALV